MVERIGQLQKRGMWRMAQEKKTKTQLQSHKLCHWRCNSILNWIWGYSVRAAFLLGGPTGIR